MEQATDVIGNPIALLIERSFWLGLGVFLLLTIITSLIRGLNESRNENKPLNPKEKELRNLAKKAIQQNSDKY